MSVANTVETDVKSVVNTVSTDLVTEVNRLSTLLETAKNTIVAQAQTIAGHVAAAVASNNAVAALTSNLKSKLDDFEALLSNTGVATATVATAGIVVPLVVNTAANVANVVVSTPA